jgi:hypothetical protein
MVGDRVAGKPVLFINRRIFYVRIPDRRIEKGNVPAIERGKGKIVDVEFLGRITTPLDRNSDLLRQWMQSAVNVEDASWDTVVKTLKAHIDRLEMMEPPDCRTVDLDFFTAAIINEMEDKVFVYPPSPRSW